MKARAYTLHYTFAFPPFTLLLSLWGMVAPITPLHCTYLSLSLL